MKALKFVWLNVRWLTAANEYCTVGSGYSVCPLAPPVENNASHTGQKKRAIIDSNTAHVA